MSISHVFTPMRFSKVNVLVKQTHRSRCMSTPRSPAHDLFQVLTPTPGGAPSWPLTEHMSCVCFVLFRSVITQYELPCVWLLLLNIMLMSFTHTVSCSCGSLLSLLYSIPLRNSGTFYLSTLLLTGI